MLGCGAGLCQGVELGYARVWSSYLGAPDINYDYVQLCLRRERAMMNELVLFVDTHIHTQTQHAHTHTHTHTHSMHIHTRTQHAHTNELNYQSGFWLHMLNETMHILTTEE